MAPQVIIPHHTLQNAWGYVSSFDPSLSHRFLKQHSPAAERVPIVKCAYSFKGADQGRSCKAECWQIPHLVKLMGYTETVTVSLYRGKLDKPVLGNLSIKYCDLYSTVFKKNVRVTHTAVLMTLRSGKVVSRLHILIPWIK